MKLAKVLLRCEYLLLLLLAVYSTTIFTDDAPTDEVADIPSDEIADIPSDSWDAIVKSNKYLLVLFYETDCDSCKVGLDVLKTLTIPDTFHAEVQRGKSPDKSLASRYGVKELPSLVFFRDGTPALYDGKFTDEDVSEWIYLAQEIATKILNDDSFEHLTQASTGATTGDWLVIFYKDSCNSALAAVETVGTRVRRQMNVAKVDMETSPTLVKRFQLTKCPSIIYFRQRKMYRYEITNYDSKSLTAFIENWHKNVKAESVPRESTAFDRLTESIALYLKKHLEGPQRWVILGVFFSGIIVTAIVLALICLRKTSSKEKSP